MSPTSNTSSHLDPHLPWDGEFPYDRICRRLAEVGGEVISVDSTAKTIGDAFFDLMGQATQEDRLAWDELRQPERRLVLDFFRYQPFVAQGPDAPDSAGPAPMQFDVPPASAIDLGSVDFGDLAEDHTSHVAK